MRISYLSETICEITVNKNPNRDNLKPFKKGHDPRRNLKGAPKLPNLEELMAEVLDEQKDGKTAAQQILAKLVAKAIKGDIRAAEVLFDRGYGRAKQAIDLNVKETDVDFTF